MIVGPARQMSANLGLKCRVIGRHHKGKPEAQMMIDYAAKLNGAALFGGFPTMWPDRKLRSPVNIERINILPRPSTDRPSGT